MVNALASGDRRNAVWISTPSGGQEAVVFTSMGQRLQDLLNDGRLFLPVEVVVNGTPLIRLLNKRYIVSVDEVVK